MANVAVINAVGVTSYAFASLADGKDAFSRVVDYVCRLPEVERIHLLTDSKRAEQAVGSLASATDRRMTVVYRAEWDVRGMLTELQALSEGCDDLFYCYADCPLLDSSIAERMYSNHRAYFSEYTFADGYPQGMTPEILRVEVLPAVMRLVKEEDTLVGRDTIFTILQRDINAFDIETEISPKDLRLLRVQLHCDTRRNFEITGRIMAAGGSDEESILEIVAEHQELLRSVPAFFEVQITEAVSQEVSYSPYPKIAGEIRRAGREISVEQLSALATKIAEFADDAMVSLSLWGEPALHSRVAELAEAVLRHERLELLIETSGIGWDEEVLASMKDLAWRRITWIVDLDASTRELYESLRGPGWDEAQRTCARLIELFADRVHVQAVRMKENEADLESFYRYWKERVSNVIIQKYDWFCGYLPQKKVTDLTPLRRQPCWHLKRDMNVLVDGSVPMCREDLMGHHLLGNAFEQPLEEIWSKGQAYYVKHIHEEYPELCKGCDEYYTYNF